MRQVVFLTGLLAVALVGSYTTWTAEDAGTTSGQEALVYTATAEDLQKIVWDGEKARVEIERRKDDLGEYVWVVATDRKEVPVAKAEDPEQVAAAVPDEATDADPEGAEAEAAEGAEGDAEAEAKAEPEVTIEETTTRYLGNTAASDIWTSFAPLKAMRELGPVAGKDLSALGFDEPAATLTVHRRSGPLELVVGGETYGSKDRFVRAGDTLYLVDDATLRPIEFASSRLIERSLHPLAEKDVDKVEVRGAGGESLVVTQQNADDRAKAFWAREGAPETADETAGTWLGKLWRLRINAYVDQAEVTAELQPVFTYAVTGDGKTWTVEVLREVGDTGKEELYARSNYNRSLARLTRSLAADAAADLGSIFAE